MPAQPQFSDDSSLEVDDTQVTERPVEAIVSPQDAPVENQTFVGYQPPKPKTWQTFAKKHSIKIILGVFVVGVVALSGSIYVASSRPKEVSLATPDQNSQVVGTQKTSDIEEEKDTKPDITLSSYSLAEGGKMYKLVSDGEIWLERADIEWMRFASSRNWLYFTSKKTPAGVDPSSGITKIGIEAFNYKSKEYVSLGELDPPQSTSLMSPMKVQNGYLYISFSGQGTQGAVYRCQLTEEKACGALELFYDSFGEVFVINDEEAYILSASENNGIYEYSLKRLAIASKQVTDLKQGSLERGAGEYVAGFSKDGFAWIAQTSQLSGAAKNISGEVVRLTAYDSTGNQKFVITPDSFPLAQAGLVLHTNSTRLNEILFANDEQQVVFNMDKKEFEPIERRQSMEQGDTLSDFLDRAEESLQLPSLFSIKEIL